MSNVEISVGGRAFRVACADGQESRIERLGRLIDAKAMESGASGQTETRMLLYAALLLADDLDELMGRSQPDAGPAMTAEMQDRLTKIAEHIENVADLLERSAINA